MAYRKYKIALTFRIIFLFLVLTVLAFAINWLDFKDKLPLAVVILTPLVLLILYLYRGLIKFISKRFEEMDDFFESVRYRDFSRWFTEKSGKEDIRELHKGFNEVNKTIKEINAEKEAQHLYLRKILELIDTGILAFNMESGKVLWVNDSFKKNLSLPSIKTVQFVEERKADLYQTVFVQNHKKESTLVIDVDQEKTKILISSSIVKINDEMFKLIVLQNIDDPLNRTESEAWKKLLSVMTHEIMNSIVPISSLAETLQFKVQKSLSDPKDHSLDMNDLDTGIESIKKRSEGLLKFAKTYRSLNKITKLNLSKVLVWSLFENIKILMEPSLKSKDIALNFQMENEDLKIEIDTYLIEQVLINLVLNAVEACKGRGDSEIVLTAVKNTYGHVILKVTDNGKGIPEEILDEIFVPFFSTKKSGSGIGLSLCKQIVLLHHGKIQVKSVENKGTSISLVF